MKRIGILSVLLLWSIGLCAQDVFKNDTLMNDTLNGVAADTTSMKRTEGDLFDLLNDDDLKPMDQPLTSEKKLNGVDSLKVVPDSMNVHLDSLDRQAIPYIHMDVVMPEPVGNDSLVSDSLINDSVYQRHTLDSLGYNGLSGDSLLMDELLMDSTVIDTLKFDSVYYYQQLELVRDSLRRDSIRQRKIAEEKKRLMIPASIRKFTQMISTYRREFDQLLDSWDDYYLTKDYVKMRPEFYKYVVPLTYYSSSIREVGNIDSWQPYDPYTEQKKIREKKLNDQLPDLCSSQRYYDQVERSMLEIYVRYPALVKYNETRFANIQLLADRDREAGPREENVLNMIQTQNQVERVTESDLTVFRPNFWTKGGSGYLQFSQNHISDNWYKGGESTKSLLSGLVLFANFNDKQRVQFENKLEWKLGFITAPSDTLHSYKANNDLFRLTSKFGLRAIRHWYYTLSADFKTQLFSSYQTNTDNLVSAFFSPAELNIGLGMDYKYIKDGVCNLSVLLNPINYTLYTVVDDRVDPTKFNIKEGHKHESVFGSRFEANLKWKIFTPLIWESRLSYTTNYEKALAEWENTFTFVVNKYLSTKLFVHGRFDDGVKRKEDGSYFQLQEILSFVLNYTW